MPKPRPRRRIQGRREPLSPERRRFIQVVGLVGATSALGSAGLAFAQTAQRSSEPAKPTPVPAPPATAEVPPEIAEDAKALVAILARRYGKHLDAEQLAAIERELQNRLRAGRVLRAAKLGNHDEPDTVFRA